jgi:hypothetical protein
MIRRWKQRRRLLALVLATLAIGSSTSAQVTPEGPIVFGEREKHDKFTLNWWRAALEGEYRYQKDVQKTPGSPKTTFTEHRFEETFTLETNSSIYHPNLCELNAAGTFGLTQTSIKDDPGESDNQLGTLYEWDINALFLRKEDTTYTLYTRRSVDTVDRTLGPTLDNIITTYGGIVDMRNVKVPTRIEIFHMDQEQTGIDDEEGSFTLAQNTLLWHSEYRPTSRNTFTLDYNLSQVSEDTTGFPSNDYLLNDFTLSHVYNFGAKDQHSIESTFNYFNQSGDFPLERIRWTEDLRLKHSKSFETEYRYVFDNQTYQGNTQTTNRGTAGFTHYLYKSLVTTGEVGIEKIDQSEGGGSLQYFANINFDYTKIVPLGTFDGGLGYAWSRQENDANDGLDFLNQVATFNDPAPIIITAPSGVDTQSIVITDTRGLITYQPGLDYIVRELPTRVEIDRVVGGRIDDGQSVLLDYTTLPAGANTTTTNTFSLSLRYNFEEGFLKGISPYFRFVDQKQTVNADDNFESFIPNSFTDTIIGVEYRIWKFTLGYEREWYDSTIQPFNATRYTARYVDRFGRDTVLNADARYEQIEYLDEDNEVNFLILTATLNHRFSNELNGSVTVLYRNEQDQLRGDTTGIEEQIEVYWQKRQLRIFAQLRNVDVNSDIEDRHFQYFRVGLRREF